MKKLSALQIDELLMILKARFEKNSHRHQRLDWSAIQTKLIELPDKLWSLSQMEMTSGEPDIIGYEENNGKYIFCDCSVESPMGRRSLCYDDVALQSRKENKPANSAIGLANEMGIEILSESQYRDLQKFGPFDTKTSSWVLTPPDIRNKGGAVFCDYRYGRVFLYHNGAESYYSSRGFRGMLLV